MNEQTFELIKMILEVVITAFCLYLVPVIKQAINSWINTNMTEDQIKTTKNAISFAYQMLAPGQNEEKKAAAIEYVTSFAISKGWNITDDQISQLIEAMYATFKANGNKWE